MSGLIKTDEKYSKWIKDISKRFRQSQLKAAVKVNDEMLRFRLTFDVAHFRAHDENLFKEAERLVGVPKNYTVQKE